jgi:hypothetical protein
MTWACEFSEDAEKDLRGLPKAIQKRIARALGEMAADPFRGNVKPLQGKEWKGVFRRRLPAAFYDRPDQEVSCRTADLSQVRQNLPLKWKRLSFLVQSTL